MVALRIGERITCRFQFESGVESSFGIDLTVRHTVVIVAVQCLRRFFCNLDFLFVDGFDHADGDFASDFGWAFMIIVPSQSARFTEKFRFLYLPSYYS